jgi:hypothetical protein
MKPTPTKDEIQVALNEVRVTVDASRALRKRLRRRHTPKRDEELAAQLAACASAAEPIRSLLGMSRFHDFAVQTDLTLKRASADLRLERNQLRKMLAAK